MSTPPEIAWIVPIVVPFIVGVVVGFVTKHAIKLVFAIAALIVLLVLTGYISISYQDILAQALKLLPRIISTGIGLVDILPWSSLAFVVGLAFGLWKG